MSNEVYGYLKAHNLLNRESLLSIQEKTGVGISQVSFSELYNFPETLLPSNDDNCLAFVIGDKPGKSNATYLTDYIDYAPGADIGMPLVGKERLMLLINTLMYIIKFYNAERFVVAITDSSQIEEVRSVKLSALMATIIDDFERFAPPDCVYDVIID